MGTITVSKWYDWPENNLSDSRSCGGKKHGMHIHAIWVDMQFLINPKLARLNMVPVKIFMITGIQSNGSKIFKNIQDTNTSASIT